MSRENLEIRQVEMEHLEQYNELLKYVFQVTENEIQKVGLENEDIKRIKAPNLDKSEVIGWFDGETLVSQVVVYPMKVNIFNRIYDMGGVTGVGTYPEYSNLGLMKKLLNKALNKMQEAGQYISYLYPYSIPYYRKKGWEVISDKIVYEIEDYQLPKNKKVSGRVKRVDKESDEIKDFYNKYSKKTHGALLRNKLEWNEYWLWDNEDIMSAVYYNENEELKGYLIYWIEDEVFHVKDMIFANEEARNGLWNFISAHFSMITKVVGNIFTDEPLAFLLEDADIKEVISPYFMARIVDFEKFIENYPFKADTFEREWTFNLKDPLLEWNEKTFKLSIDTSGKGKVSASNIITTDTIDIQTMTTMLLGYKRPEYLNRIGRLSCNKSTLNMLEDAIEQQVPYFSDYF